MKSLLFGALVIAACWMLVYAYSNRYMMCAYSVDRYPGGVYVMDQWTGEVRNIRTYPVVVKPQLRKGK